MDKKARIPLEPKEEFDRWFWDHRPIERPGDSRSQLRSSALQAKAPPAELSPGHSIDSYWLRPPPPLITYVAWYRQRAEECGDLAADMVYEGLEEMAGAQAARAAHFGRIANELYAQRAEELRAQHPEWWRTKDAR